MMECLGTRLQPKRLSITVTLVGKLHDILGWTMDTRNPEVPGMTRSQTLVPGRACSIRSEINLSSLNESLLRLTLPLCPWSIFQALLLVLVYLLLSLLLSKLQIWLELFPSLT